MTKPSIGIVGAGKLGIVLAQLAVKAGYTVRIASSRPASKIKLTIRVLAPGAEASDVSDLARQSDLIILALPLSKFRVLDPSLFSSKLVVDAMNYWDEVDGPRRETVPEDQSSSEAVQEWFANTRVVKALSHMGYHELHDMALPSGSKTRKAIAIAGDDPTDTESVAQIVDDIGFDSLIIGNLRAGRVLEPGLPGFGVAQSKAKLEELLR